MHCKNRKEWFKEFVERVLTIHSSDVLLILSNCVHYSDTGSGSSPKLNDYKYKNDFEEMHLPYFIEYAPTFL